MLVATRELGRHLIGNLNHSLRSGLALGAREPFLVLVERAPHKEFAGEFRGKRRARLAKGGLELGALIANPLIQLRIRVHTHLPNESRLSCGALKKDSFHNLRAPPASSAC